MSKLDEYKKMRNQLEYVRWKHLGEESIEEDLLLDKMDEVWRQMTSTDRLSMTPSLPVRPFRSPMVDVDVSKNPGPVRRYS